MKKVGNLLSGIFRDLGIGDAVKLETLRGEWLRIFREPMSLHTFPSEIKDGDLLITVDSPVWLQQLGFFKQEFPAKLSFYDIKSVRFRHGRIPRDRGALSGTDGRAERPERELRGAEIAWIDETVSNIGDDELKETVRKAIEKALRRKH